MAQNPLASLLDPAAPHYEHAGSIGGQNVYDCGACGATVRQDKVDTHDDWHLGLHNLAQEHARMATDYSVHDIVDLNPVNNGDGTVDNHPVRD